MTFSFLILCVLISPLTLGQEYVPGTPGAVWSENEVSIVREKIMELLSNEPQKMDEMFPPTDFGAMTRGGHPVSETVLFRLSFHDCLAYQDGSPGCKFDKYRYNAHYLIIAL